MKKSVTGLITMQHEVKRLENLFHKIEESAYYLPGYGLDWKFMQSPQFDVPVGALLSHLNQKASENGIVILDSSSELKDFTLNITAHLLSEAATFSRKTI